MGKKITASLRHSLSARGRSAGDWGHTRQAVLVLCLLVGACFPSAGCVKYVPVALDAVPPQEEVRVVLNDAGAIRAARQLGRIRNTVDAEVSPLPADSVAVIVWLGKNYPGTQFENVRETVVVPRNEVANVYLRRISPIRTVATAAATVAVFAYLTDRIFFQEDPNPNPGDGDENPPPAGFTLIRIPIGRNP